MPLSCKADSLSSSDSGTLAHAYPLGVKTLRCISLGWSHFSLHKKKRNQSKGRSVTPSDRGRTLEACSAAGPAHGDLAQPDALMQCCDALPSRPLSSTVSCANTTALARTSLTDEQKAPDSNYITQQGWEAALSADKVCLVLEGAHLFCTLGQQDPQRSPKE